MRHLRWSESIKNEKAVRGLTAVLEECGLTTAPEKIAEALWMAMAADPEPMLDMSFESMPEVDDITGMNEALTYMMAVFNNIEDATLGRD